MSIKITIPNSSSDVLTFGSGNTPTAAQIAGIDSGSSNGQLALYTTASGTSTERVRVDASGNVGIGTSNPSSALTVGAGGIARFNRADNNTYNEIKYVTAGDLFYFNQANGGAYQFNITGTERMRLDASGNLLVGKTALNDTTAGAQIAGAGATYPGRICATVANSTNATEGIVVYSSTAGAYRFYVSMDGKVNATNTTIAAISDQRLKENIRDLDDGLSSIMALQPRKFDWKEGKGADIKNVRGFVAQEFETVFPDLVDTWKDPAPEGEEPYKSVRADLIPTLVKAIQEQQAIITSLTDRITALEGATS